MHAEQVSLYYKDARSNKEYHAQLEQQGDDWVVLMQYGPRGGTLTSGAKTKSPVAFAVAKKAFDKLVAEKLGKGYGPSTGGSVGTFVGTPLEQRFTGIVPQLLNPIDEAEAQKLLTDDDWLLQPKHDGHHRMVQRTNTEMLAINRKGLATGLPEAVVADLGVLQSHAPYILDGELIGETFVVFDLLEWEGMDMKQQEAGYRVAMLSALSQLLVADGATNVVVTETVFGADAKRALYERVRAANGEGLVFKRSASRYIPGRPSSGGNMLKRVFTHRATVQVVAQNDTKRSVRMALLDEAGSQVEVGNVTIPPNYPVPAVGSLAEVEYLYSFKGGSIFQPRYQGERDDIEATACTLTQLVYKPEAAVGDDGDDA